MLFQKKPSFTDGFYLREETVLSFVVFVSSASNANAFIPVSYTHLVIGICGGDGIGPRITGEAQRVLQFLSLIHILPVPACPHLRKASDWERYPRGWKVPFPTAWDKIHPSAAGAYGID